MNKIIQIMMILLIMTTKKNKKKITDINVTVEH